MYICLISSLLWVYGVCTEVKEFYYQINDTVTDNVCSNDNRVFETQTSSLMYCVAMAATSSVRVSYHEESQLCYGCDISVDTTGEYQPLTGAVSYQPQDPDIAEMIPEGFVNVSGYVLRFDTNHSFTYEDADILCAKTGYLVRIDSTEKHAAIISFLEGYEYGNCWIQCRKNNAGVWTFDDGTPVSIIPDTVTNDEGYEENCCAISYWGDFVVKAISCTRYYNGYICEHTDN